MVDEATQRLSSRRVTWYALAALALVAIAALQKEKMFMRNYAEEKQVPTFGTDGSVGAMTPSKPKPIKQITILGERNSGTRWTYR